MMNQPDARRPGAQPSEESALRDEHLRNLGLMLSGFAHELNTPLGVIASMCDGMLRCHEKLGGILAKPSLDDDDLAAMRKLLAHLGEGQPILSAGVERAQALARELRMAARPECQDASVPVDLVEIIEGDLLLLQHLTRQGITVERRFVQRPRVLGRPAILGQVFLNLIRNAAEALGGEGTITISVGEQDDRAVITVTDDGPGVPDEVLERLFHEECTTKCPETGTGLGLFMSHRVLSKHQGTLEAANRPSGGAVFTVTLPLA